MDLPIMIITAALAVTLLGAFVFWRGWRGKRVGDHPFCRRCGFDLFGKPDQSTVCPECGADISGTRATVVGVRKRRSWAITAGSLLLLLGLSVPAVIVWGAHRNIDWQRYKPFAWLLHDAGGTDPVAQAPALRELLRRYNAGSLSKEQISTAVDVGLKVQGSAAQTWDIGWGNFIQSAHDAHQDSDAQWRKFAEQAVSNWLKVGIRPRLRRGSPVWVFFDEMIPRVGSYTRLQGEYRPIALVIDGKEFAGPYGGGGVSLINARGGEGAGGTDARFEALLQDLPLGPHDSYLRVQVTVRPPPARRNRPPIPNFPRLPLPPHPPPPVNDPQAMEQWLQARRAESAAQQEQFRKILATQPALAAATQAAAKAAAEDRARDDARPTYADVEVHLPFHFELIGADQPLLTPVTDEKLRAEVEGSLSVDKVFIADQHVHLRVKSRPVRTNLSFSVILRDGQKEWPANEGFASDCDGDVRLGSYDVTGVFQGSGPTGPTVDVVLRPDPNEATNPRNFPFVNPMSTTYWGREVVLRNVPVRPASEDTRFHYSPSTRPASTQRSTRPSQVNPGSP